MTHSLTWESEFKEKYNEIDMLSSAIIQSMYEAGGGDDFGMDDELW